MHRDIFIIAPLPSASQTFLAFIANVITAWRLGTQIRGDSWLDIVRKIMTNRLLLKPHVHLHFVALSTRSFNYRRLFIPPLLPSIHLITACQGGGQASIGALGRVPSEASSPVELNRTVFYSEVELLSAGLAHRSAIDIACQLSATGARENTGRIKRDDAEGTSASVLRSHIVSRDFVWLRLCA